MSIKTTSVYIFFGIFILGISVRAEDAGRRWSISAGAKTRRVEYSFDSRGLDNWQDYITPLQSRGSANLCRMGGEVHYEDGGVSEISHSRPGAGNSYGGQRESNPYSRKFHSTIYGTPAVDTTVEHKSSDTDSVAPYFKVRRSVTKIFSGELTFVGWGCIGYQTMKKNLCLSQNILQDRTRYEFIYQKYEIGSGFYDLIVDPNSYPDIGDGNPNPNYPQRNVVSQDTVTTGILNGLMDAEVDIYWYELTLGVDWSKTLFNRLDLFALVGPTAHILDWEMEHNTTWTIAGENSPVTTTHANDSGTKTLVGGVAELGINLYLDSDRRYFIEASGEYLYLEDVTLHAGAASVEIDPESWGGKLGIGIML